MLEEMDKEKMPILVSDVIFKSLFMKHTDILLKFIYDVTGYLVIGAPLIANELPIVRNHEKFKRCDFLIHSLNKIFNIELNSSYSKTLLIKNTSYIFSLFSSYTSCGDDYEKDLEVIQINVNYFSRFDKPILDYKILNDDYDYVYLDALKIYDLDIVKCRKLYYNERVRKRKYVKWGALFSCVTVEEMIPILDELLPRKDVMRVVEDLYNLTAPGKVISESEALRLDDMFRRSLRNEGVEEGRKVGIKEGSEQMNIEMVKGMLEHQLSYQVISKISHKTEEEIKEIEKAMISDKS